MVSLILMGAFWKEKRLWLNFPLHQGASQLEEKNQPGLSYRFPGAAYVTPDQVRGLAKSEWMRFLAQAGNDNPWNSCGDAFLYHPGGYATPPYKIAEMEGSAETGDIISHHLNSSSILP
jgi:hypothetical protein